MKKRLLWPLALILILFLLSAAQAEADQSILDFASFSGGRFVVTQENDYGFCTLTTYEASFTDSDKAALEEIMSDYKDWFMGNSEMSPGGEHSASFGRFGAYAQDAFWFSFNESAGLTAYSLNLVDTQAENCHVMLAFKEYEDKFGLDMYVSKGIELTEVTADPFVIPDFAAYVGGMMLGTEEISGQTVYKLPKDTASKILSAYAAVLNESYGFSSLGNGKVDGMNYVWFEDHETIPSKSLDDFGLEGESCFMFAFANVEGEVYTILYPNDGIVMQDTGERYQTNIMVPEAVNDSGHDSEVRAPLPDFAAYAGDAILENDDGIYTMNQETGMAILDAYSELLENEYGLSANEDGLANNLLLIWYTDYVNPEAAGNTVLVNLDDGTQAEGYFFFIIGATEDKLLLCIRHADGMTMVDNGERYAVGQPVEEEPKEKLTVPTLEAFMSDAVKEVRQVDGVTSYRIDPDNASSVIQYLALLENYGLYQVDGTEEEYGMPMYLFVERCEQDLEPMDVELHGSKQHCYVLIAAEPLENDYLITVSYADCLAPVDTGERWDGVTVSEMVAAQEKAAETSAPAVPAQPEQPASSERVLVSEPTDASALAYVYSPDTAFMQDMVTYCAGRLSYDEIDDSSNYMVRNYKGKKSDYQLVKDYVDMLVETNPYLELVDSHEENYGDIFYSFAIDYTGSVNLGPQTEQVYTDNMCDIMLYGTIERDRLELSIWTPANVELVDLGMRYGGTQADVSIGGESALAGLYRNADGAFETTDGRFRVAPGEAMILRDGEVYTTEATFDRDDDGNRDRIWMRYFYRNETLHFSYPTRSLMTGDLFRLSDFDLENSWLLRDRGIFDDEKDLTGYRWNGLFLGANHNGVWMTPVNNPASSFTDATVRVMYMDKEIAVFYIFAEYTTAPYTMEALCAVPLTDNLTEDEVDYTTYVGQSINVSYEWTQFGASFELFDWEIISGGDLASLSNEKSKTCTLTANKPGLVGLRVTYNYGTKEPDVLTGNPSNVSRTKTQDYTIRIK